MEVLGVILAQAAFGLLLLSMAVLCLFMLHPLALAGLFLWTRRRYEAWLRGQAALPLPADPSGYPTVCVQLPLYNEAHVVRRVIRAAAALDWPRDALEIQVLDDSTDQTTAIATGLVEELRAEGVSIRLIHRTERTGFKAGALQAGVAASTADFFAIFDADFVPEPDFLKRMMPTLMHDPRLAFAQARWAHLNADHTLLTRAQSLGLDLFFRIEQPARSALRLPITFNGTCGIWRRRAIEDAGGWSDRTLAEDLDLSYRAQLRGWTAVYRSDVAVQGELPEDVAAWRTQQYRWTKGPTQVARRLIPSIWRSDWPVMHKLAASIHPIQTVVYVYALILMVFGPLAGLLGAANPLTLGVVGNITLGLVLLARVGVSLYLQRVLMGMSWGRIARCPPILLSFYAGLSLNNSKAVAEAWAGHRSPFERTPKSGGVEGPAAAPRAR